VNEISTALIETIRNSTHAARLQEALRVLRDSEAERTSGIAANGGMDEAPQGLIDMLDAGIYEANEGALWAAEELKSQLEDVTTQFGMFFASNWGEGGDFAVWIAPELGWCCQPATQVAGFNK
jgi:hypothetical protein